MMFFKLSKKSTPKHILIVSLTNIGDVILTCPVIDILRRDFPQAKIDVIVGAKAVTLFEGNPNLLVKVFNKRASFNEKISLYFDLCRSHYDCVIDMRRTALAFFLGPRFATSIMKMPAENTDKILHKKDVHLSRLRQVYEFETITQDKYAILTTHEDESFWETVILPQLEGKNFVLIAPGAADSAKRWHANGFATLADYLSRIYKVIFVGDVKDVEIVKDIQGRMKSHSISLAGKINLRQLAFVLKKSSFAITHDSGVMHLASYFNIPVLVLWGPTDINKYAPWSSKYVIVKRNEKCIRCQDPKSNLEHNCMSLIQVEDVINAVTQIQC